MPKPAEPFDFSQPPPRTSPVRRRKRGGPGVAVALAAGGLLALFAILMCVVGWAVDHHAIIVLPVHSAPSATADDRRKPDMTLAAWSVQQPKSARVWIRARFENRGADGGFNMTVWNVSDEPAITGQRVVVPRTGPLNQRIYEIVKDGEAHDLFVRLAPTPDGPRIEALNPD